MARFPCPYLKGEVELTTERHPDLLPRHYDLLVATLAEPDLVRRSPRLANTRLISPWFDQVRGGKHLVAVVVKDLSPESRHWLVTAYFARRLAGGEKEWQRD